MKPDDTAGAKQDGPEAKAWVMRLVEAQGIILRRRELGWWSVHLQEFLRYCRLRGDRVDARVLARGYYDDLRQQIPAVASVRVEQTKQALTVFLRGIENWHWEQSENGEWAPRFRLSRNDGAGSGGNHSLACFRRSVGAQ